MSSLRRHLTYANVVSTMCLFLLLGGAGAVAAGKLKKNSVGTKQIKKNAVNGTKVADGSLTGADINASTFGQVPKATSADTATSAGNAQTVGGHAAACPAETFLHNRLCFDEESRTPAFFFNATTGCNTEGGFMPTQSQLRSIRNLAGVNLGADAATGHWVDAVHEDDDGTGTNSIALTDAGGGAVVDVSSDRPFRCAYQLLG
jgi:hypothetical protein